MLLSVSLGKIPTCLCAGQNSLMSLVSTSWKSCCKQCAVITYLLLSRCHVSHSLMALAPACSHLRFHLAEVLYLALFSCIFLCCVIRPPAANDNVLISQPGTFTVDLLKSITVTNLTVGSSSATTSTLQVIFPLVVFSGKMYACRHAPLQFVAGVQYLL